MQPEAYQLTEGNIQRVLKGEMVTYERQAIRGGRSVTLNVTLLPEFDEDQKPSGFIIVANDISKQKEIQSELKQAKEAAEVANATKSAFLANMSHEIRTPLGAVIGFSELLMRDELSASEKLNSVEVIKRNGRLLSNIINDILDLSKVEAGKLEVERVPVPFAEIMKEIGSILNLEAVEKGIELTVTSDGVIPNEIVTDPLRLRQILFNIVGNAIKFTPRGTVNVKLQLLPSAVKPKFLAFVVKDTGEGIDPAHVGRLFKPFTQADPSTTRKFGGTGLGLVLSKKLAQALGGDIVLTESMRGQGSTFTITIDPGISEQVLFHSSADLEASNVTWMPKKKLAADLKLLRVLVVDDSSDNQALLKRILRIAGATVETANNGKEGVEKALQGDFSLVLMDLQMPVMDGYEATKMLRDQGYTKPIIALTAHAMKEERQRSLRSGFDDHITKPIDQELLIRTLSEYTA
jgi:signal transduction histidine kinase/CheY-like chemotaxis protein